MMPAKSLKNPKHIAIIMDGNYRWAKNKGLAKKLGHRHGAEAAKSIVNACVKLKIPYLTLFAFSSENWMRPDKEIQSLMALFLTVLKRKEIKQLHDDNVSLVFIGQRSLFSKRIQAGMREVEMLTKENTGTKVIIAADYGGRWDLVNATQQIAEKVLAKELVPDEIDINLLKKYTSLYEYPDPDLCIRTGGEKRLSNFLLWQFAYTELYFTECYWPDFDEAQLQLALGDYAARQRRYGGHEFLKGKE
ncbi:MAG: polyprenyl diphosphate synthase [Gammaproteobacteria bacterium]|nr:polyprenyl diphosphate synthase [Gammaproteobacteria bacterium]